MSNTNGKNFRYVQFNTPEGRGVACVCFDWQRDGSNVTYKAGVSFCSPKDTFSKLTGRIKAESRYNGSKRLKSVNKHIQSVVTVPEPKTNFISNSEFEIIFRDIVAKCEEKESLPSWVRDSVEDKTYRFGLTQQVFREPGGTDSLVF